MTEEALPDGLERVWNETLGSSEICVAVLDGAVDLAHPAFIGARLTQLETLASAEVGDDIASQHGTHVASLIFGQHGSQVRGIAPACRGVAIPIYPPTQEGLLACSQLDLARAIKQAVGQGAHVINISGGELSSSGVAEPMLAQAIQHCEDNGVLIVAAAGNDGCACLHLPAALPSVLAVGAMDAKGWPLGFSNWGHAYQAQGILAPGQNRRGAVPGGGVVEKSGTSFATALVSGVAALLLSLQLKHSGIANPKIIRAAILDTADACDPGAGADCQKWLAGTLNIGAAHRKLAGKVGIPPNGRAASTKMAGMAPAMANIKATTATNNPNQSIEENSDMTGNESLMPPAAFDAAIPAVLAAEYPMLAEAATAPAVGIQPSAVQAAECTCQKARQAPETGYVLGQIGYDFGTEAKRDGFLQLAGMDLHNPANLLEYLKDDPASAANLVWTLSMDATVVYAIQPYGPYANIAYDRLKEFLDAQIRGSVERVSIPGIIHSSVRLLNGQKVPVIFPDVRGMYAWSTDELMASCCGEKPDGKKEAELYTNKANGIRNFLERIYYEIRNLGTAPQERAMNYAATNAFQVSTVYSEAIQAHMRLDHIAVERSPICRPGSDCWDVKLTFFNPSKRLEQARHVYRFTVDVSETIPVTVGPVRHWDIY